VLNARRSIAALQARRWPRVAFAALLVLGLSIVIVTRPAAALRAHGSSGGTGISGTNQQPPSATTAPPPGAPRLSLARQVGQLVIGSYQGQTPPASLLSAIRQGHVGAVILMGGNTAGGISATRAATARMQSAAAHGGNPRLLIMTDQEGGTVKRLSGPPRYAAIQMANPVTAYAQGRATGVLLKSAGVNVDLAPVADVIRVNGFIEREDRSFGASPAVVAEGACRFAAGLAATGVAYTLKHFPGLGDAVATTDTHAVDVRQPASQLYADGAAYRRCGHSSVALVMISSASYLHLTGSVPAVLDPKIYAQTLMRDRVTALTISDDFESGAIDAVSTQAPARTAINAGLDMVMYADSESVALNAYASLLQDARHGTLSRRRVRAASDRILALKARLALLP
jgi:beta-N-acetylhexosaminidase